MNPQLSPAQVSEEELVAFVQHLRHERQLSENTVSAYRRDLDQLLSFARADEPGCRLSQLTRSQLRQFLSDQAGKVGSSTLARKMASFRAFYRFCLELGMACKDPAQGMRMPKIRRTLPLVLSPESAQELMDSALQSGDPVSLRDQALLELLYGSGLRVNELVGLDMRSIDWAAKLLHVVGKGRKERRVPLTDPAITALRRYLACRDALLKNGAPPSSALFLGVRGARLGARRVQELVSKCGAISSGRPDLHPHALRHACATHMLEGGADLRAIQDMLGHQSVTTTVQYTHLTLLDLSRTYDRAHPHARQPRTK